MEKSNNPDLLSTSTPIKLSDIDVETYEYKVYGLDDGNKIMNRIFRTQEKIPGATGKEKRQRAWKILKVIKKHKLTREGLTPTKLRLLLEDLGPTFVKLGQIMSKRNELLPKAYCKELEKLCSDSNVLEYEVISSIVEHELGQPIDEVFSSFNKKPIGSASIGQVHKATLKSNKQKVVVKIQRPDIDIIMRQDIMLFRMVIRPLKLAPGLGGVDLYKLLDDLWKITQQELNFFVEATNTIKFRKAMSHYKGVTCPKIYKEYTTQKVLTMEFIDGFSIDEAPKKPEIDCKELGNRLAQNFIAQVLNEEFFHADPHQGNIFVRMKDDTPEIVWIDFGMVHHVPRSEQTALKKAITAITQRDTHALIFALMSLTTSNKPLDQAKLYMDVDYLVTKYSSIDLKEINIGVMLSDILSAVNANGLQLSSTINILARGLVTLEGVLTGLTDELNLMAILRDFILRDIFETDKIKQIVGENVQNAVTSLQKGIELPALTNDMLRAILRGQARINLNIDNTDSVVKEFKHSLSGLFLALVICSLILGSAILCAARIEPLVFGISVYSIVGTVIAFILSLILFAKQMLRRIK